MGNLFSFLGWGSRSGTNLNPKSRLPEPEPILLESIIGGDDRVPVSDIGKEPWRKFVCLRIDYGGGIKALGTGVLIAPDMVLTAAHNLYSLKRRKFAKSILAEVGVYEGQSKASARANRIEVCSTYTKHKPSDVKKYLSDYGVIRLADTSAYDWAKSLCDAETLAPLSDVELKTTLLNLAGYPNHGASRPPILYRHDGGTIHSSIHEKLFSYEIDTLPGQSGAPVFAYDAATKQMRLAGIHVAGGETANSARRYNAAAQSDVKAWRKKLSKHKARDFVGV